MHWGKVGSEKLRFSVDFGLSILPNTVFDTGKRTPRVLLLAPFILLSKMDRTRLDRIDGDQHLIHNPYAKPTALYFLGHQEHWRHHLVAAIFGRKLLLPSSTRTCCFTPLQKRHLCSTSSKATSSVLGNKNCAFSLATVQERQTTCLIGRVASAWILSASRKPSGK